VVRLTGQLCSSFKERKNLQLG
ncbi:Zinc finger protein 572, partial [Araneus ventricosus]